MTQQEENDLLRDVRERVVRIEEKLDNIVTQVKKNTSFRISAVSVLTVLVTAAGVVLGIVKLVS